MSIASVLRAYPVEIVAGAIVGTASAATFGWMGGTGNDGSPTLALGAGMLGASMGAGLGKYFIQTTGSAAGATTALVRGQSNAVALPALGAGLVTAGGYAAAKSHWS